ncbi:MAG TPA: glycosyl hydrolase [Opitutus sp.]|nr:glycosyl hydrolase [Opitutus sp.]
MLCRLPPRLRALVAALAVTSLASPRLRAGLDAPVSPHAQPAVGQLLQFLNNAQGQYLLAGQQEFPGWPDSHTTDAASDTDFAYIMANTGRTPAVHGFDFLFYVHSANGRATQHGTERAIAWWQQSGGIVTFCCHMFMDIGSPAGNPQFYVPSANNGTGTTFDIRQAVIDGTPEHTEYLQKLDIIAVELTKLRDAGVPVVWRPFHECSGGWFWWGAHGAAPLKAAWQIMFDRFENYWGLNNLIWDFNPTDSTANMQAWYPGDDMVDIISLDIYPTAGTHPTYATSYQQMRDFRGGRKVVTLSENGAIPDIDALFSAGGGWAYFCTWNGFESNTSQNSVGFLNTAYNHDKVATLDELPALYAANIPTITVQPQGQSVAIGAGLTLNTAATGSPAPALQWQQNGAALAGETGVALGLTDLQPADSGIYTAVATSGIAQATSTPVVVGVTTAEKVVGTGSEEIGTDIIHPNGNTYDQILLGGAAAAFTADAAQVTRLSYIDPNDDIVQVEFSGAGTVSLVLDEPSGPALPVHYNQSVTYMKGHAGIVVTGANETSNLLVFTVGRVTALNQALFKDNVTYDGVADLAFVAISSTNGKFGGLRLSDANLWATRGLTGIYAPGIEFNGPVYVGNIDAMEDAVPYLVIGSTIVDARITGGDMRQDNHRAIRVAGISQLKFTAGSDSHGNLLPAQTNLGVFWENGTNVTSQIVLNP